MGTNSPEAFLTFKVIYFRYISGTTYLSPLRLSINDRLYGLKNLTEKWKHLKQWCFPER